MPPKRKATSKAAANPPSLKVSKCDDERAKLREKISDLKNIKTEKIHKIDNVFPKVLKCNYNIHEDYDCVLNQTNINCNNNKFYIIQLIVVESNPPEYIVWTRWGRVGETGQSAQLGPYADLNQAKSAFEKKFREKSGNKWDERDHFKACPGKYSLVDVIEMEATDLPLPKPVSGENEIIAPSKLDEVTQSLIRRIFDPSMFEFTMEKMNLDLKKMPLGKLSAKQIATALEVLDELGEVIDGVRQGDVNLLSSKFYTVIPHCFGRQRPPPISTQEKLREKLDMLLVLTDVHFAQQLQTKVDKTQAAKVIKENPLDEKYHLLNCELVYLDKDNEDRKMIEAYFQNTGNSYHHILNIWKANRSGEDKRFQQHSKMENHKLLWHGTSVAVVAAILTTGLRIMPHSGGLVGRGLYFASQADKSQGYGMADRDGHKIMFLVEVALGKEHHIYQPDHSIRKPPDGFDSVVAVGRLETDSKSSIQRRFDNLSVIVPYGKPETRDIPSHFYHSEYLIYQESQSRLRYVIEYTRN